MLFEIMRWKRVVFLARFVPVIDDAQKQVFQAIKIILIPHWLKRCKSRLCFCIENELVAKKKHATKKYWQEKSNSRWLKSLAPKEKDEAYPTTIFRDEGRFSILEKISNAHRFSTDFYTSKYLIDVVK